MTIKEKHELLQLIEKRQIVHNQLCQAVGLLANAAMILDNGFIKVIDSVIPVNEPEGDKNE